MLTVASLTFDSECIPPTSRLDDWRLLMSATHDVTVTEAEVNGFRVNMKLWSLGELMISAGQTSKQTFVRSPLHVRQDQIDHYLLFIQGYGQRFIRSEGKELVLNPGDVAVMEMNRPCWSFATEGTCNSVYLPRDAVQEALPGLNSPHGYVLQSALGGMLARHVQSMATYLTEDHAESAQTILHLVEATKHLAIAGLASIQHESAHTGPTIEHALRGKIERYISANLSHPELGATSICRAFGLSRSSLYRLFARHSGVANFIRHRRLDRIRSILIASNDDRTLTELARDFGFGSIAHLSRSFRDAYGCAPSDLRLSVPSTPQIAGLSDPLRLAAMFR